MISRHSAQFEASAEMPLKYRIFFSPKVHAHFGIHNYKMCQLLSRVAFYTVFYSGSKLVDRFSLKSAGKHNFCYNRRPKCHVCSLCKLQ